MALDVVINVPDPVLLHATSAVPVTNGVVGGAGGAKNDSKLVSVVILKGVAAVTLTVAGFAGEDGQARNIVLTGSTTADTVYNFGAALRNTGAAMTLTASVADSVLVGVAPG